MEMSQISGLLIFYHIACTRSLEASECEVQGSPTVVLEAVQTSARSVEQVISLAPNFRIFCALSGRALCSQNLIFLWCLGRFLLVADQCPACVGLDRSVD